MKTSTVKKTVKKPAKKPSHTIDFDVPAPDDFGPRRRHIDLEAVDEELHNAMQAKLVSLSTKPVTARSLLELEQMTRLMRQFVVLGMDPMAMKVPHHHQHTTYQPYSGYPLDSTDGLSGSLTPANIGGSGFGLGGAVGGSSAIAPSPPVENFGATIVRELMSLLGAKKPEGIPVPLTDTDRLIDAIALAREKGLKDVEKTLMKQLVKMQMTKGPLEPTPPPDFPPSYVPLSPLALKKPKKTAKTTNGAADT